MFHVKKFCDMVGVNYSTLRHFERVGLLSPYQDEENGYRKYTPEDAFRVNVFKYYRSLGYDTKEAIKLVEDPDKEYVKKKLIERESELIDEVIVIKNQIHALQRLLEDISYIDNKSRFRIGRRKDLLFLPVSNGYDFELARYEDMVSWVEYLPLTRYSKLMQVSSTKKEREVNVASFGMSIEEESAYLLTEENKRNARYVQGGECIFYYSTSIESPYKENDIYDEISAYIHENEYEIYGDIYMEGLRILDESKQKGQIISIPVKKRDQISVV